MNKRYYGNLNGLMKKSHRTVTLVCACRCKTHKKHDLMCHFLHHFAWLRHFINWTQNVRRWYTFRSYVNVYVLQHKRISACFSPIYKYLYIKSQFFSAWSGIKTKLYRWIVAFCTQDICKLISVPYKYVFSSRFYVVVSCCNGSLTVDCVVCWKLSSGLTRQGIADNLKNAALAYCYSHLPIVSIHSPFYPPPMK